MDKKLVRLTEDKKIAGVCAGIAEYFNVDPTIVRAAFVILALMGGPGVILYIALLIVMPEE